MLPNICTERCGSSSFKSSVNNLYGDWRLSGFTLSTKWRLMCIHMQSLINNLRNLNSFAISHSTSVMYIHFQPECSYSNGIFYWGSHKVPQLFMFSLFDFDRRSQNIQINANRSVVLFHLCGSLSHISIKAFCVQQEMTQACFLIQLLSSCGNSNDNRIYCLDVYELWRTKFCLSPICHH